MDKKNKYLLAAVVLLLILEWGIGFTTLVARGSDKKSSSGQRENKLTPWELPVVDAPNVLPGSVNAVVEDSTGIIWIATDNGLVRVDPKDNSWRIFSTSDGLASNYITSIHVASDRKVWFGTWEKGVTYYDPSKQTWRIIPTANNE